MIPPSPAPPFRGCLPSTFHQVHPLTQCIRGCPTPSLITTHPPLHLLPALFQGCILSPTPHTCRTSHDDLAPAIIDSMMLSAPSTTLHNPLPSAHVLESTTVASLLLCIGPLALNVPHPVPQAITGPALILAPMQSMTCASVVFMPPSTNWNSTSYKPCHS
jgi:hypothetical protein